MKRRARRLYELTELLYAHNRWAVLFIFQALDGAGKDSAVKHVMRGLDPKSTQVYSFKAPSTEELKHDFMWRCMKSLPERGRIGIFNRSYYEEVLISRVHPELLEKQRLPKPLLNGHLWRDRFEDIKAIERYLARNGTVIRKIFLNVSKTEQRRRFLERLHDPAKKWKFSVNDVNERLRWTEYISAYEKAMCATSTIDAPWYIVPADHKWFTRLVVAAAIVEAVDKLGVSYPQVDAIKKKELAIAREKLDRET